MGEFEEEVASDTGADAMVPSESETDDAPQQPAASPDSTSEGGACAGDAASTEVEDAEAATIEAPDDAESPVESDEGAIIEPTEDDRPAFELEGPEGAVGDVAEASAADSDLEPEDEIAAAVAAAAELVGPAEGGSDSTAPSTTPPPAEEPETEAVIRPVGIPWWPFLIYLGLWVVLAGLAVWQVMQIPADQAVYETQVYSVIVFAGVAMAIAGPLLIFAVWLGAWSRAAADERAGLLTSALMKGAPITFLGVIIWWATIMAIDYVRLGRLF